MTNLPTFNQTPQRTEGILGCVFNGITDRAESENFEAWIATLTKLAEEHERQARVAHDTRVGGTAFETRPPLQKVAPGPFRSLGGYFDYSQWPDRERFLELDKAIASSHDLREPEMERGIELV